MKSFDEFWNEFAIGLNADENEAQAIYEEGAQSRQAEIDELKKRIDDALNKFKDFYSFGDGESCMAFCNEIINVLKGEPK